MNIETFSCNNAVSVITLIVAFSTFIAAKKIMVNQIFAGLVAEYRTPEMGGAILALFNFYDDYHTEKNKGNNVDIDEKYRTLYDSQIRNLLAARQPIDYSQTLHFQRRQVAQFYTDMAHLRDKCPLIRLPKKEIKNWFTPGELDLLKIILLLEKPAKNVFINVSVPEPEESEVSMYKSIRKLYKEAKRIMEK